MRTFHTGGVSGSDITSGLPRVEELFEARVPKSPAILSEIEGTVEVMQEGDMRKLKVVATDSFPDTYEVPANLRDIGPRRRPGKRSESDWLVAISTDDQIGVAGPY